MLSPPKKNGQRTRSGNSQRRSALEKKEEMHNLDNERNVD